MEVSGWIDPFITIDPNFLQANPGYSVTFSDGIINPVPGGVPEAATWAMVVIGFGALGTVLRRCGDSAALTG